MNNKELLKLIEKALGIGTGLIVGVLTYELLAALKSKKITRDED